MSRFRRYKVTLDLVVDMGEDGKSKWTPNKWEWENIIDIDLGESVEVVGFEEVTLCKRIESERLAMVDD